MLLLLRSSVSIDTKLPLDNVLSLLDMLPVVYKLDFGPFRGKHAVSVRRLTSARGIFTCSRSGRDMSKLALHSCARTTARASLKVR